MGYVDLVCPHCNSKQKPLVGPNDHEVKSSACARMISVEHLMQVAEVEAAREEANELRNEEALAQREAADKEAEAKALAAAKKAARKRK